MKKRLAKIHGRIKEWVTEVLLKKYITPVILIIVYFFVLGPTSLVARFFLKKALTKSSTAVDSSWIAAENFNQSLDESKTQS